MLSTTSSSLDQENAAWSLYAVGQDGAELLDEGEGREALEQTLMDRALEPHQIAFSCGI